MSSDYFLFDDPFYLNSSSDMVSSDGDLPFFHDSTFNVFQEISDSQNHHNPVDESRSFDQYSSTLLSSSPSQQFESLNVYQSTHLQCLPNGLDLQNGFGNLSGFEDFEVKNEECQMGFESSFNQNFAPHSYGSGAENVAKLFQRSYSSNCFDGKPGFLYQPRFDTFMESSNFPKHDLSPPERSLFSGQMRRVCSTGDLQNIKAAHTAHRSSSSPLAMESSFIQEANSKVSRYSAEERKERISKYKAKRTQRNFNKTIKYACRKTLADNRPRIRGRFARNDETVEIPKAACSNSIEDEDDLWLEGMHEIEDNGTVRMGQFGNTFGATQIQYYGFRQVEESLDSSGLHVQKSLF